MRSEFGLRYVHDMVTFTYVYKIDGRQTVQCYEKLPVSTKITTTTATTKAFTLRLRKIQISKNMIVDQSYENGMERIAHPIIITNGEKGMMKLSAGAQLSQCLE